MNDLDIPADSGGSEARDLPGPKSEGVTPAPVGLGEYLDERVLSAILHTSLSAITAHDFEGRFVFANRAAERVLRLEMSGLVNQRYNSPKWRLLHLDGRPLLPEEMPFVRIRDQGETLDYFQLLLDHEDGDRRVLALRGVPLKDEAGRFRLAVFALDDVTDQVAATEELRRTHELYRSAIQNADAMVYMLNFTTGRYEVASPGMAELLGSPASTCSRRDWGKLQASSRMIEATQGLDPAKVEAEFRAGLVDRIEYEMEVVDPRTGQRRWFSDCSMPVRVPGQKVVERSVGLLIEITRRREAELQLQTTHDLYRDAIHNARSMFYVFNLDTLAYDMASPEFAAMLGKDDGMASYADWEAATSDFRTIHPADEEGGLDLIAEMRAGRLERVEFEVSLRDARTNEVRCFRDHAMPIRESNGGPIHRTLGLLVDVTPQQRAQAELQAIHDIYGKAIQNANAMLYVLNFRTGIYEVATPEFQRLLGKRQGECTKSDWSVLVQECELINAPPGIHLGNVVQMLRDGFVDRVEFEVKIADPQTGSVRWFRDSSMLLQEKGKPSAERCLGLLIDVTQGHEAQSQLLDVHEIYRKTIANANGIPYLINHRSHFYDYVGQGISVVFGNVPMPLTLGAFAERVVDKRILEPKTSQHTDILSHMQDGDVTRYQGEVKVLCHDGLHRWFLDTSLPVRDGATGEVTGSVGILQDITDRVREKEIDDALGWMTTRLGGARTPRDAAAIVLEAAEKLFDWDIAFLLTYNALENRAAIQLVIDTIDGIKQEFPEETRINGQPGPGAQRAINEGAYVIEHRGDEGAPLRPIGNRSRRSRSLMFVPLMADKVCTGVLSLQSYKSGALGEKELSLAKRLADACAVAVARIDAETMAREAQTQLLKTHDIYRRAIENANGIPYLLNHRKAEFEYAGSNIEKLLGRVDLPIPRSYLTERIIDVRVVEPAGLDVEALKAKAESGEIDRYIAEMRLVCHDGVARWFLDTALPLEDPETRLRTRSLGILQDITDRVNEQEIDQTLGEMGTRLGAATTPLEAARIVVDAAQRLLGWDAAFVTLQDGDTSKRQRLLSIDTVNGEKREFEGGPLLDDPPGEAYLRCIQENGFILNPATDPKLSDARLNRFGNVDRSSASMVYVSLSENFKTIGVLSIQSYRPNAYDNRSLSLMQRLAQACSAAIGRTLTAEKLRETEYQLLSLAESAPGVMYQLAVGAEGDRHLTYISASVEELWGISAEEFMNHPMRVLDLIHPTDLAGILDQIDSAINRSEPYSVVYRIQHPSGDVRWVRSQARPGPLRMDGSRNWNGLMSDITALLQAEDKRRRLDEEMQHLDKLESLGLLAGGVAHDFNNLLSGVVANASLALADLPSHHPAHDSIRQIETAASRMSELSHQMLAYSGRGRFENKVFDLSLLATETVQLVRSSMPASIQLHMAPDPEPVMTSGDLSQIRQIILNLVTNAREAIGDKPGTITVRTGRREFARLEELPPLPWRDEMEPGRYVYLSVEDTGSGMDEETMRRIFEPFFSTKFTGRGLGLPASQGILRAHKGAIEVSSEPGSGSTFTIKLPATTPAQQASATAKRRQRPARPEPLDARILIVDDEESVRRVLISILKRSGIRFEAFADGASALAHVATTKERIDAVLLDMTMPGMNGAQFYERVHELRPGLPIVVMSGYAEQEVTEVFGKGALAGFLSKPFKPADVTAMLTRAIAMSQTPTGDAPA